MGVMAGAASDLRPGLSQQMIEIHEPVRQMFVVETTPEAMQRIMKDNPGIRNLIVNNWVYLAVLDPHSSQLQVFRKGDFEPYDVSSRELPTVASSESWYRGWRDHLGFASVVLPQNANGMQSAENVMIGPMSESPPAAAVPNRLYE